MELTKKTDRLRLSWRMFVRICCCLLPVVLFFSCLVILPYSLAAAGTDKTDEEIIAELLRKREEKLWQQAHEALNTGKDDDAALFFWRYWRKYPESPNNEEALWQAANLYRELALTVDDPDWEKVAGLFRSFTLERPDSPHVPYAYFQVGNAYFQLHFYREALTYFSLFVKRYPEHPLAEMSRYMQARCLMRIGRIEAAGEVYRLLAKSSDPIFSLRGQAGEGHVYFAGEKYHDALATYLKILRRNPDFYIHDPVVLLNMGISYLRVGNEEEGRQSLLRYLNMTGLSDSRPQVLFELAESYMKTGQEDTARRFYARLIDEGDDNDKLVTLSRFRLAQQKDRTAAVKPADKEAVKPADKEEELTPPPSGDKPFQEVLDRHYSHPLSQDARLDLLKRHWQRQEYDDAYTLGKAYLRHETTEAGKKEVEDIMGQILELKAGDLFDQKKYEEVYALYKAEYPYVKTYKKGGLLFLAGRALEEMSLFKQASVIYYRALALELTELDKRDLYIHRAQCYLSDGDVRSAQRLLKYLRKIYAGDDFFGEICFLSGRLRDMQQRPDDALEFYRIAVGSPTIDQKKDQYARHFLNSVFALDKIDENAGMLDLFQREKWLEPQELQSWYSRIGDYYRQGGQFAKAEKAYLAALADEMPRGDLVPVVQVYLGDVLIELGLKDEGVKQYQNALDGSNELAVKMAGERLSQIDIRKAMRETEAVLGN